MSPLRQKLVRDCFCTGVSFEVVDKDALAAVIGLILVQEYSLARALLHGSPPTALARPWPQRDIDDIISRRLCPTDPDHRDGFLFQLMMWVAAHLDLAPGDIVSLPHCQASAKGQDSLLVHRDAGSVVALTICEDKATENPRRTIRRDVWPEIRTYEAGGRQDELRAGVIAALGTAGVPSGEAEALIRAISWQGRRSYRVRVTIGDRRTPRLFDGFDKIVGDPKARRRGETARLPSLRIWMEDLASRVEAELRNLAAAPSHV